MKSRSFSTTPYLLSKQPPVNLSKNTNTNNLEEPVTRENSVSKIPTSNMELQQLKHEKRSFPKEEPSSKTTRSTTQTSVPHQKSPSLFDRFLNFVLPSQATSAPDTRPRQDNKMKTVEDMVEILKQKGKYAFRGVGESAAYKPILAKAHWGKDEDEIAQIQESQPSTDEVTQHVGSDHSNIISLAHDLTNSMGYARTAATVDPNGRGAIQILNKEGLKNPHITDPDVANRLAGEVMVRDRVAAHRLVGVTSLENAEAAYKAYQETPEFKLRKKHVEDMKRQKGLS
jgi:hypothetical protein